MIKAVLFDLDGTLVDSPQLIMNAYESALKKHTNHIPSELEKTSVLGMTLSIAFKDHAKDENHLNELIDEFRRYSYENTNRMLKPYKNVKNVIQYLRDKDYLVGIVTSKNRKTVLENLEAFDLNNMFDCIVTSNDTINHKPHAEPINYAMDLLKVNHLETIYIGDHENDIIAGNNANVKTGLMKYSYRLNQALKQNPTYVFEDLNHIKETL